MNFADWLKIQEMSSFSIPSSMDFEVPCDRQHQDLGCHVGALDMRFEDPPQTRDALGRVLNQWSGFVARIPNSKLFLVYDRGTPRLVDNTEKVKELLDRNKQTLPELRHTMAVWQQTNGPEKKQLMKKIQQLQDQFYTMIPDNWWEKAEIMGKDYERIKVARGDLDGSRAAGHIIKATGLQ